MGRRAADEPVQAGDTCLRCGKPLYTFGVQDFRIGGSSGVLRPFVGVWGELGEDMLGLEVLACRGCGKVELRIPLQD